MSELERKFDALRSKQCGSKRRYDSEPDARRAAAEANVPYVSEKIEAYKCPWCSGWHIGASQKERG